MTPLGLAIVGLSVLVAVSIIGFSLKLGISPMPSSRAAQQAMLAATVDAPAGAVIDLGSGWGQLAIAFAKAHPGRRVIGYERSWVPWAVSCLLARAGRLHNLSFRCADFRQADLSEASILLCYLFPGGMQALALRLQAEALQPPLIVSNTFALPSRQPDQVIRLADLYRSPVYIYRRPALDMERPGAQG